MRQFPSGTVTFLFTDIEGSTKLLHELGDDYADALSEHRRALRAAFEANSGVEVDTQGDAFFVAFSRARDALAAAREGQEALGDGPVRVRMGVHTGEPLVTDEGYVGIDVHRAARIAAVGHGGQVLVSQSTRELAGADGLRDLGEHRLKDLTASERLYQLGDGEFPPLKSLNQSNLPVQPTPFVGREKELGEVLALLRAPSTRLLTLTGAGGSGKTRLAVQAAAEVVDDFEHGVWWVPLQAVRDPARVGAAIGSTLGAREELAGHIGSKQMLLVLDNFEQVAEAAPELGELLAACLGLRLLVTSRELLRLAAEREYSVPPLVEQESVGFFLSRARAARPGFEPDEHVLPICRRLDHLPLALELAAARVKALSTAQILERLEHALPLLTGGARDLPERQRTLRGAIAWSYELLPAGEQEAFRRLGIFSGGWTLEAAEQVAGADIDALQSLVEKSLVRFDEERYSLLETIREFAHERLDEAGELDEARRRHFDFYLALAEAEDTSAEAGYGTRSRRLSARPGKPPRRGRAGRDSGRPRGRDGADDPARELLGHHRPVRGRQALRRAAVRAGRASEAAAGTSASLLRGLALAVRRARALAPQERGEPRPLPGARGRRGHRRPPAPARHQHALIPQGSGKARELLERESRAIPPSRLGTRRVRSARRSGLRVLGRGRAGGRA